MAYGGELGSVCGICPSGLKGGCGASALFFVGMWGFAFFNRGFVQVHCETVLGLNWLSGRACKGVLNGGSVIPIENRGNCFSALYIHFLKWAVILNS